ncbi:hypothetical protein [Allopontixanthobacter sp.]|uniref:hypothetical protein n=1 Tax=Allopontixanthobacter sp. TaxID=2906452 RepID=UPI002AB84D8A|nr:hypothetical protein [Allopontixanthobacter sp.]MDZ4307179.1 hypothetical protein [Allopontixanthobacter sp.]
MTDKLPLVPEGISHELDLASLTLAERMKHHQRQLRSITLYHGISGANAYKARFHEAVPLLIHSAPVAYRRKPKGYPAALANMVNEWFDSETAVAQSNRADVGRLNCKLGSSFNPANHFSKPLPAALLRKLAELFSQRGAHLDVRQAKTISSVRKAVKAAKVVAGGAAVPMGAWGTRSGGMLAIGCHSFAIEQHNGHECIRLTVEGSRPRIRLDALGEFLSLTGLVQADPRETLPTLLYKSIGALPPIPETEVRSGALAAVLPEHCPQADKAVKQPSGRLSPDETPNLSERIRAMTAVRRNAEAPVIPDGLDPLAITDPLGQHDLPTARSNSRGRDAG